MNYFKPHYNDLRWPITEDGTPGLRMPQLGAMHAIAAHFTRHATPAIVTMPTGSGKTGGHQRDALPFTREPRAGANTQPNRSRADCGRIQPVFLIFSALFGRRCQTPLGPTGSEHCTGKMDSLDEWLNLRPYDVIIGTPNSTQPGVSRRWFSHRLDSSSI